MKPNDTVESKLPRTHSFWNLNACAGPLAVATAIVASAAATALATGARRAPPRFAHPGRALSPTLVFFDVMEPFSPFFVLLPAGPALSFIR